MNSNCYKKMAGTSAVFINANYAGAAPLERDGLLWTAEELHLDKQHLNAVQRMAPIANALALEGLEEYEPASHGDVRFVSSIGVDFIYSAGIKAWIQSLD